MPHHLATRLTTWAIQRHGAPLRVQRVAADLRCSWDTARSWLLGTTLPRDRDLADIVQATGIPLANLRAAAAKDRAWKRRAVASKAAQAGLRACPQRPEGR